MIVIDLEGEEIRPPLLYSNSYKYYNNDSISFNSVILNDSLPTVTTSNSLDLGSINYSVLRSYPLNDEWNSSPNDIFDIIKKVIITEQESFIIETSFSNSTLQHEYSNKGLENYTNRIDSLEVHLTTNESVWYSFIEEYWLIETNVD